MQGLRGKKYWLNIVLFLATVVSAFIVGISWSVSFRYAEELSQNPSAQASGAFNPPIFEDPQILILSFLYASVLIVILLGHELGHYLTCRHYRIEATLPFFIPAPTLIGTLGAFIKIKSPITRRSQLFDIGVAGPLTGFILALPTLIYGLSLSKIVPALPKEEALYFGEPLLLKIVENFLFRDVPQNYDLFLHPVAFAGWVGILVTSFNLFPVGQLDGGHVAFALIGPRSKLLGRILFGVFIIMGIFFWVGWIIWVLIILMIGLKHPPVYDEQEKLSPARKIIGVLVIIIFVLSFIPDPIKGYNLFDVLKEFGL